MHFNIFRLCIGLTSFCFLLIIERHQVSASLIYHKTSVPKNDQNQSKQNHHQASAGISDALPKWSTPRLNTSNQINASQNGTANITKEHNIQKEMSSNEKKSTDISGVFLTNTIDIGNNNSVKLKATPKSNPTSTDKKFSISPSSTPFGKSTYKTTNVVSSLPSKDTESKKFTSGSPVIIPSLSTSKQGNINTKPGISYKTTKSMKVSTSITTEKSGSTSEVSTLQPPFESTPSYALTTETTDSLTEINSANHIMTTSYPSLAKTTGSNFTKETIKFGPLTSSTSGLPSESTATTEPPVNTKPQSSFSTEIFSKSENNQQVSSTASVASLTSTGEKFSNVVSNFNKTTIEQLDTTESNSGTANSQQEHATSNKDIVPSSTGVPDTESVGKSTQNLSETKEPWITKPSIQFNHSVEKPSTNSNSSKQPGITSTTGKPIPSTEFRNESSIGTTRFLSASNTNVTSTPKPESQNETRPKPIEETTGVVTSKGTTINTPSLSSTATNPSATSSFTKNTTSNIHTTGNILTTNHTQTSNLLTKTTTTESETTTDDTMSEQSTQQVSPKETTDYQPSSKSQITGIYRTENQTSTSHAYATETISNWPNLSQTLHVSPIETTKEYQPSFTSPITDKETTTNYRHPTTLQVIDIVTTELQHSTSPHVDNRETTEYQSSVTSRAIDIETTQYHPPTKQHATEKETTEYQPPSISNTTDRKTTKYQSPQTKTTEYQPTSSQVTDTETMEYQQPTTPHNSNKETTEFQPFSTVHATGKETTKFQLSSTSQTSDKETTEFQPSSTPHSTDSETSEFQTSVSSHNYDIETTELKPSTSTLVTTKEITKIQPSSTPNSSDIETTKFQSSALSHATDKEKTEFPLSSTQYATDVETTEYISTSASNGGTAKYEPLSTPYETDNKTAELHPSSTQHSTDLETTEFFSTSTSNGETTKYPSPSSPYETDNKTTTEFTPTSTSDNTDIETTEYLTRSTSHATDDKTTEYQPPSTPHETDKETTTKNHPSSSTHVTDEETTENQPLSTSQVTFIDTTKSQSFPTSQTTVGETTEYQSPSISYPTDKESTTKFHSYSTSHATDRDTTEYHSPSSYNATDTERETTEYQPFSISHVTNGETTKYISSMTVTTTDQPPSTSIVTDMETTEYQLPLALNETTDVLTTDVPTTHAASTNAQDPLVTDNESTKYHSSDFATTEIPTINETTSMTTKNNVIGTTTTVLGIETSEDTNVGQTFSNSDTTSERLSTSSVVMSTEFEIQNTTEDHSTKSEFFSTQYKLEMTTGVTDTIESIFTESTTAETSESTEAYQNTEPNTTIEIATEEVSSMTDVPSSTGSTDFTMQYLSTTEGSLLETTKSSTNHPGEETTWSSTVGFSAETTSVLTGMTSLITTNSSETSPSDEKETGVHVKTTMSTTVMESSSISDITSLIENLTTETSEQVPAVGFSTLGRGTSFTTEEEGATTPSMSISSTTEQVSAAFSTPLPMKTTPSAETALSTTASLTQSTRETLGFSGSISTVENEETTMSHSATTSNALSNSTMGLPTTDISKIPRSTTQDTGSNLHTHISPVHSTIDNITFLAFASTDKPESTEETDTHFVTSSNGVSEILQTSSAVLEKNSTTNGAEISTTTNNGISQSDGFSGHQTTFNHLSTSSSSSKTNTAVPGIEPTALESVTGSSFKPTRDVTFSTPSSAQTYPHIDSAQFEFGIVIWISGKFERNLKDDFMFKAEIILLVKDHFLPMEYRSIFQLEVATITKGSIKVHVQAKVSVGSLRRINTTVVSAVQKMVSTLESVNYAKLNTSRGKLYDNKGDVRRSFLLHQNDTECDAVDICGSSQKCILSNNNITAVLCNPIQSACYLECGPNGVCVQSVDTTYCRCASDWLNIYYGVNCESRTVSLEAQLGITFGSLGVVFMIIFVGCLIRSRRRDKESFLEDDATGWRGFNGGDSRWSTFSGRYSTRDVPYKRSLRDGRYLVPAHDPFGSGRLTRPGLYLPRTDGLMATSFIDAVPSYSQFNLEADFTIKRPVVSKEPSAIYLTDRSWRSLGYTNPAFYDFVEERTHL